jgi:hypothetical protein
MPAPDTSRPRLRPTRETGVRATVFGLDVDADVPLSFLREAPAMPTGRELTVVGRDEGREVLDWPGSGEIVCDQRGPDGTVNFRIEAHHEAGYLIWGPTYGRLLLSLDGRHVRLLPGECDEDSRQRLLIAQVLPFAALLRGLEVFHASAVVRNGGAIAFVGPSRAGKTSIALELCNRGASFLADDVLAVERTETQLLGHPGTPVAGLDHAEARRLDRAAGSPPREVVATNTRERLVRMRGATAPAPLLALFFLDRRPDTPGPPSFEPSADAQLLLASTFNSVLRTPQRLRGLLDVCALAARLRVERIRSGSDVDAAQLGAAIERRLDAST